VELAEALRTTGAVREFEPRAVDDEVLFRILDTARFAPNGGNRQAWRVVVVRRPEDRRVLRDLYLPGWYRYLAMAEAGLVPWSPTADRAAETATAARAEEIAREAASGPGGMAEHFDEVPALLLVLADLDKVAAVDRDLPRYTMAAGASIYPFVWSLLLAARTEGLRGVVTTMPIFEEGALREHFGIPDHEALAAAVALGYPVRELRRLTRRPVAEFARFDRYDGPPVG
jgi:nitroreductase